MKSSVFAVVAAVFATVFAPAFAQPQLGKRATIRYDARTLYQLPNGTWLENLAVRKNGQILASTISPSAALYLYDPAHPHPPTLVHNFTGVGSAFGITEYAPDIFGVVGGNRSVNGSFSIYKVNLTRFHLDSNGTIRTPATVSLLAPVRDAQFLNGLTTWNSTTLLAADATQGVVYSIDSLTGASRIALRDPLFSGTNGSIGVNGVTARGSYLYFSSTTQQKLGRIELHENGTRKGNTTVIAQVLLDDFAVGRNVVYGASNGGNALVSIALNGTVTTILGGRNSTAVLGPTSIRFGRSRNWHKVFVTTSGGRNSPVNGYSEGGKLIQLNITKTN